MFFAPNMGGRVRYDPRLAAALLALLEHEPKSQTN
jgi:hypothetical protein